MTERERRVADGMGDEDLGFFVRVAEDGRVILRYEDIDPHHGGHAVMKPREWEALVGWVQEVQKR